MEGEPILPPEQPRNPEKAGELDTSKKKKKRKGATPEALVETTEERGKKTTRLPRSALGELFAKKDEEAKTDKKTPTEELAGEAQAKQDKKDSKDTELEEASDSEMGEVTVPEAEEHQEEITEEGEIHEEDPIFFTRTPRPWEAPRDEIDSGDTEEGAEPIVEAAEGPGRAAEATDATEPEAAETPLTETSEPPTIESAASETSEVDAPEAEEESLAEDTTAETYEAPAHPPYPEWFTTLAKEQEESWRPTVSKAESETEPTVTVKEMEDEIHRANRRGVRRGVIAGGIAGWWLGRRDRKDLIRRAETAEKEREEEIKRLTGEQKVAQDRLRQVETHEAELASQLKKSQETAPLQASAEQRPAFGHELISRSPLERPVPVVNGEQLKQVPERLPEEEPITEETYRAPVGRHVETSTWHRYEVDDKTGKVVENPELAYGEEFIKEQRQERLQREAAEPQLAVQLGQTVLTQADDTQQPSATASPSVIEPDVSQQKPARFSTQELKRQFVQYTTNPAIWIAAFFLVVLLFAIGVF